MFTYLLGSLFFVPWTILSIIGVKRGLQHRLTVYNSPFDAYVTAVLCLLFMADVLPDALSPTGLVWSKAATLLVALYLLWTTKRANLHWRDFSLAIPAKLSLMLAFGMSGPITLLCLLKAFLPNTELKTALMSGIMAAVGAWASVRIYKIFFRLFRGPPRRPDEKRPTTIREVFLRI